MRTRFHARTIRAMWVGLASMTLPLAPAVASQCGSVDASLNVQVPCLEVAGSQFALTLTTNTVLQPGGLAWELGEFAPVSGLPACPAIRADLGFEVDCVAVGDSHFRVNFAASGSDAARFGLFWTLAGAEPVSPPGPVWSRFTHPCVGNRTDAFWWDDDSNVWVGCGSTTIGTGLYRSTDGGQTWSNALALFDTWRVLDIRRASDGRLYVGGTDVNSSNGLVSLDTTVSGLDPRLEYARGSTISLSFTVGHVFVDPSGNAFIESLTGNGSAARAVGAADWTGLDSSWATDGQSYQILDMTSFNGRPYAVGSTISQPPVVFVPAGTSTSLPAAFYSMTPVDLSSGDPLNNDIGEMWGVAVLDAQRVVAVGVDQNRDTGRIYVSRTDPLQASDYRRIDVSTSLLPGTSSWMRGVCASGNTVVAVGEKQPLRTGTGVVLRSTDGGETWENITDPAIQANSVSACHILSDGRLAVAGAGGYVGILTP